MLWKTALTVMIISSQLNAAELEIPKAFVNGEETPIFQTNYVLRGVEVPAGVSEVQLVFEPASFRNGRMITGAGTLIVYGWLLVFGLQAVRRKEQDEDPDYS